MTDPTERNEGKAPDRSNTNPAPTTWTPLSVAVLCAAIIILVYLLASRNAASSGPPRRVWTPVIILPNGMRADLEESRRLEFWTPSVKTKDYLAGEDGSVSEGDKWEILTNEQPVLKFGELLRKDSYVLGYRRAEVWGHGRTGYKPGWWWTMTVTTNYTIQKFRQDYSEFWKTPHAIFVEVLDNRGRND